MFGQIFRQKASGLRLCFLVCSFRQSFPTTVNSIFAFDELMENCPNEGKKFSPSKNLASLTETVILLIFISIIFTNNRAQINIYQPTRHMSGMLTLLRRGRIKIWHDKLKRVVSCVNAQRICRFWSEHSKITFECVQVLS